MNNTIVYKDGNRTLYGVTYEKLVTYLIRKKYSVSDEFAIHRQKDTKPVEYEIYNVYCENCKLKAKQIMRKIEQ